MGTTYTGTNAVALVKPYIKSMPLTGIDVMLVDQINSIIHVAYPWKWTLSDLTNIPLSNGLQDYSIIDTDVHRIVSAEIVRVDCTPYQIRDLDVVEYLGRELSLLGGLEQIRKIAPLKGNKIRLQLAASIASPVVLHVQGQYQKVPTRITSLETILPIPDHYFTVFTEGLLWRLYKYADDSRAGTVQIVKGGSVVRTGQMGVFYSLLEDMIATEDAANGEPSIFPAEPSLGYVD